jgi:NodT family efflux transporter outer membrane factor (OMF) lipoprotein
MKRTIQIQKIIIAVTCILFASCKAPAVTQVADNKVLPIDYATKADTTNIADMNWRAFFNDNHLATLIDTAIANNQDLLITLQEIEIAKNNVRLKNGQLFPTVTARGGVGIEKVGEYTSQGAGDASADITPGNRVPENLGDFSFGFQASWEADIWGKLRSAKKAAVAKYLGSIEGRNFVITNLVSEIASNYYDLLALDNQLDIVKQTIQLQKNQLAIVKVQKEAAVVTELAVKQFEAQLYNAQGQEYELMQSVKETENKINLLLGRYPQAIKRDPATFNAAVPSQMNTGIPAQLLKNRPDIKQAQLELMAAKCDVKTAELEFYPSLSITSGLGFSAFKANYLLKTPQSLAYSLAGDLVGPVVNRSAIIAEFKTANAMQIEAMYNYQKTVLTGFLEVTNELSNLTNLQQAYQLKGKESEALNKSIEISNDLFKAARANYLEVLMAQKEAMAAKLELVEAKKRQFSSIAHIYKSLGGGWK